MDRTISSKPSDNLASERLAQAGAAVADLAHLAKNILQVLSGCSEIIDLALNTNQIDRVRQAWQIHQPGFWRLKKLQLDLIKFTKCYDVVPQPCDLDSMVEAAVKQLEPFFVKRNIRFSMRRIDNLPSLAADSEKLRDVIVNLLVTAVDNLQDEPGQIVLETSLTNSGEAVQITVSDSGPRLDSETCLALYSPCERSRNMLGTGLEIPLAKQVTEAHHGNLHINPENSRTNALVLTLPFNSGL